VPTPLLQPRERAALTEVLSYWQTHWDWECPTLFGLELAEYEAAVATWRASVDLSSPQVAYALLGALMEFLFGASAVTATDVFSITGMAKPDLLALENRVGPYVLGIVEQRRTV
jgi:hypothetical protein